MYIVSACLLGENCNYRGGNYNNDKVKDFLIEKKYISVCPEVMAGFSTPREVTEILNGRVISKSGEDVTEDYIRGAELMWQAARKKSAEYGEEIEGAVLKAKSPSCAVGKNYDGSFKGKIIDGYGFAAELLKKMGIKLMTEEDFQHY
jgi:uncharacterized protein YbbK (DUF523 family)